MPILIDMDKGNDLGYMIDSEEEPWGKLIGTRRGLQIWVNMYNADSIYVNVLDPAKLWRGKSNRPKIAMELDLSRDGKAWHVDIVRTDRRYTGRNLAVRVYVLLMKKLSLQMKAGTSQSIGGRKLWNRLNRHRDILVYARPNEKSTKITLVKSGKQQLSSSTIELYGNDKSAAGDAEILAYAIG